MALSLEEFLKEKDGDLLEEKGTFGLLCHLLKIEILKLIKQEEEDDNQDILKMEILDYREQEGTHKEQEEDAIFYDLAVLVEIKRRNTGKGVKGTKNLRPDETNKKRTCLKSYYIKGEFEREGEEEGGIFFKTHRDNG